MQVQSRNQLLCQDLVALAQRNRFMNVSTTVGPASLRCSPENIAEYKETLHSNWGAASLVDLGLSPHLHGDLAATVRNADGYSLHIRSVSGRYLLPGKLGVVLGGSCIWTRSPWKRV
jgi:hypothetical protein